jgi:beta-galactosidase
MATLKVSAPFWRSYNHSMRILLSFILLLLSACCAFSDRPPVVVISSADRAVAKITDTAGYNPGADIDYKITHWPDGALLTEGTVPSSDIKVDGWGLHCVTINNLKPKLWWPNDPQLYELSLISENRILGKVRFGFRTFEAKGDRFYLNGRETFLRGVPINPPGRDLPPQLLDDRPFIRGYINLLKTASVNMMRTEPESWINECDELGMMLFAGHYHGGGSSPVAPPFEERRDFYRDLILQLASHPSVVIYVLANEVDYKSPNSTRKQLLTQVYEDLRLFDTTRPVIGNAGFGQGEPGEVFDVHRYAGWYYGNFCDWPTEAINYVKLAKAANQPITFTECVGAYTSDDCDFESMSKQLGTMIKWVGTAKDHRAAATKYQSDLVKHLTESMRRYRTTESSVAGVFPFTYLLGWARAESAKDIIAKPAFEALKTAFQPVLLSPECWHANLYAGDDLKFRLCLVNDDDQGRAIDSSNAEIEVVSSDGKIVASDTVTFPVAAYYSNSWADVTIPISAELQRGVYDVKCNLLDKSNQVLSNNQFQIFIAPKSWVSAKQPSVPVTLFDPTGETAAALDHIGIKYSSTSSLNTLPKAGLLIIGEEALEPGVYPDKKSVLAFLNRGGKILCLRQDREKWETEWLPATLSAQQRAPYRPMTYIQPRENDIIFNEITDRDLRWWNDLGHSEERAPDVAPVLTALRPETVSDLKWARVWASCDALLGGAAIIELLHGEGSVVLSQFRTIPRVGSDPCAAKLLSNLITYSSGKSAGLFDLTKPIDWDLRAFRTGAFVSYTQGLLPHSKTYQHRGNSKGRLGEDHRIDGFTLVGDYYYSSNGWLLPVPDPEPEGWGFIYGTLSRKANKFVVSLTNTSEKDAKIALKLDGKLVGSTVSVPAGAAKNVEWKINRAPGPVTVTLRGDQKLVITRSWFD